MTLLLLLSFDIFPAVYIIITIAICIFLRVGLFNNTLLSFADNSVITTVYVVHKTDGSLCWRKKFIFSIYIYIVHIDGLVIISIIIITTTTAECFGFQYLFNGTRTGNFNEVFEKNKQFIYRLENILI